MARRSKVVFCLLLAFLYVVVNICPLRAEALPDVMSGSTTLADNIMTYYALSGSAVANSDWINTLYSSYGSSFGTIEELASQGYLVLNDSGMWEPVQELGQMIEQAPAYSSLGLNEMFNVSAEEAAAGGGFAAASGGSILAGSLGGVASTGVVPLLGGVTAAYWGGIALGTLIAHAVGLYKKPIYNGIEITQTDFMNSHNDNSYMIVSYKSSGNYYQGSGSTANRILAVGYIDGSFLKFKTVINGSPYTEYRYTNYTTTGSVQKNYYYETGQRGIYIIGEQSIQHNYFNLFPLKLVSNQASRDSYCDGLIFGTESLPKAYSPDLIGENGNLEADDENGNITVPDMKPQIDPGTQAGKPLTLQDWQQFANAVQNNNNNTSPSGSPDNATLFDNILDLIRTVIPEQNPDPNPDPYSPPVVTPVPDPAYPDPVPDQQITENPQESENPQQTENPIDTGKPWRLPDLRQKFPFCVPWDIAKIFSKLKVNARQAPHISWRFNPPNTPIDYTFNLDLEDFEEVAALLRTLELMGFIVGLAFVTRYLIGAN